MKLVRVFQMRCGVPAARSLKPCLRRNKLRLRLAAGAAAFTGGLLAIASTCWGVASAARGLIFTNVQSVPQRSVGIVFGARVYPGGILSPMLRERVLAGVKLYRAGKIKKLLMTGDNSRPEYDEVTAMKHFAISQGVAPKDIVRDFAGFRTLDSCYRARRIFLVTDAVLVTQAYHLPRALFLAHSAGLDAVGFAADVGVPGGVMNRLRLRENLAICSAVLDTHLLHRKPHFLGRQEPIFGDASVDR